MAWEDVASLVEFYDSGASQTWAYAPGWEVTDVAPGDQIIILGYLEQVYHGSKTARDFLELLRLDGTAIRIGTAANDQVAFGIHGSPSYIGIDLSKVPLTYYVNEHGRLVKDLPALTIMHELQHMYWGIIATDPFPWDADPAVVQAAENTAGYDHNGSPVDFQNAVAREMGWSTNIQSSYATGMAGYSTPPFVELRPFLLKWDHSYTNDELVAITRFGDPLGYADRSDNLDQTAKGESNDLLMGFGGNDLLNGGSGRDFIYGRDGDDTIIGGSGNDEIYGGMDEDEGRADGTDRVIYTSASAAITLTLGGSTTPALTVQDGDGGTDTLHSIEIVEGSNHGDTLIVQALTAEVAGAFDYIDLGASDQDKIDIAGLSGAVTVDLRDLQLQTVTFGGAVLNLRNVEHVNGAGAEDIVYLPSTGASSTVTAGAGDDTIYLAGSGHTIDGGDGYDVLNLSTLVAGSRIAMASGSALVRGSGTSDFSGIEEVVGGQGGDIMYGDGSGTRLVGGGGAIDDTKGGDSARAANDNDAPEIPKWCFLRLAGTMRA